MNKTGISEIKIILSGILKRYFHDIIIAVEAIFSNKLRSMLTALGIIFGVAAVISMLAIGKGARLEILEQIKMVGVNNIIITSTFNQKDEQNSEQSDDKQDKPQKNKFSPGLTLDDVKAISAVLPNINRVTPEISLNSSVIVNGKRRDVRIKGVSSNYFELYNLSLSEGKVFSDFQEENGLAVCIIGENLRTRLFSNANPVNMSLKSGNVWLKVAGVLKKTSATASESGSKDALPINDDVFIPIKTMLLRFQNRALVNSKITPSIPMFNQSNGKSKKENYNQLDRIIVQVKETEQLGSTQEIISHLLLRKHYNVKDFEIIIPELLLKQQERTKNIFNIVLGAIAAISLLVGGIGIMNIMFASVMERIHEIGIRLAVGAKKQDITIQFLTEAVLISMVGGIVGVILGIIISLLITKLAGIATVVSVFSILVAFFVSAIVGIIFGYYPAKNASEKEPIESLRYE